MNNGTDDRSGREIRLLLLVIAVAVAVLLVLARFRFPEAEIVGVSPTPNPLERIVTRAPFDDLTSAVGDATTRLAPQLMTIEFGPAPGKPAPHRFLPGLRVRPDLILVHAPAGMAPILPAGTSLVATDSDREIAVLALNAAASAIDLSAGVSGFAGSGYVLVVDASAAGPGMRPVFIARTTPAQTDRWITPLLRVGGDPQAARGAFLFTLDGRLIGLAVGPPDALTIVDSIALDRAVAELAGGRQ